jgi:hypothetical protein
LDIIIHDLNLSSGFRLPSIPGEALEARVQRYLEVGVDNLTLRNLQHLGIQFQNQGIDAQTWDLIRQLVHQNHESLTSLTITPYNYEREGVTANILDLTANLENLTELTLVGKLQPQMIEEVITERFGSKLERFSVVDMGSPFSAELGRSFGTWTNLKYLCIGDSEMSESPYGDDGRPDFEAYDLVNPPLPLDKSPF